MRSCPIKNIAGVCYLPKALIASIQLFKDAKKQSGKEKENSYAKEKRQKTSGRPMTSQNS
jgi:hypothetical protein